MASLQDTIPSHKDCEIWRYISGSFQIAESTIHQERSNESWGNHPKKYRIDCILDVQCRLFIIYNVCYPWRSGRLCWVMVPKWHVAWHGVEKTKLFGLWGRGYLGKTAKKSELKNWCLCSLGFQARHQ